MSNFLSKLDIFSNVNHEKKVFYIFLLIHLVVWTGIALIRAVLPADSLEGIWWGCLHDFGSPKHPPLAAWLTYAAFMPFKSDFFVYLMSQIFIVGGFIFTYKLAKNFLSENKSMLSVIILEGCWIYSYITGYYGFNPDVVLLFTLPAIAYYFCKCIKTENITNWIKLGIFVGLSCLAKYQTGLLIIAMGIYAIVFERKIFKNIYFYLAILIAFIIFLPHLIWLVKFDFFPFLYYNEELNALTERNTIFMFLIMQIIMMSGTLIMYFLFKWKFKLHFDFSKKYVNNDFWFLIFLTFIPLVIHIIMGLTNESGIIPRWQYVFWYQTGIILFYILPEKINREQFDFLVKSAYTIMLIVFLSLGTILSVEKNYRSRYPAKEVYNDFKTIWNQKYNTPLKYIAGDTEWAYPLTIYSDDNITYIMNTYSYKNLWIDEEDLKKSGALIVERALPKVIEYTKSACPYLPENYFIYPTEYKFKVHNAFGMEREYTIYYFIVPPNAVK